jgi:hypothetical protein
MKNKSTGKQIFDNRRLLLGVQGDSFDVTDQHSSSSVATKCCPDFRHSLPLWCPLDFGILFGTLNGGANAATLSCASTSGNVRHRPGNWLIRRATYRANGAGNLLTQ